MPEGWLRAEHEAFEVVESQPRWRDATAGMVATTAPLAVGAATGAPEAGLIAAFGGLNVALAMSAGGLRARGIWGGLVLAGGALAAVVGTSTHDVGWLFTALTFVVVGAGILLRVAGASGALAGFVIAAVFVIVGGLPASGGEAMPRGLQFVIGGAVALVLMSVATIGRGQPTGRVAGLDLALLRRGLRPGASLRRHLLLTASVVTAATAFYLALDLSFGYWIPLTALAVLQPDPHATRVKMIQRGTGTVLGTAMVAAVAGVTDQQWVLVALVGVASFGLFALRDRNYHWFVTLLTPTALLMIATLAIDDLDLAVMRVEYTAAGLVLSGLAVWLVGRAT